MAQKVYKVVVSVPGGVANALGPGQTQNLIATVDVVDVGVGGIVTPVPPLSVTIDSSVTWTGATRTGSNSATFTAPPTTGNSVWTVSATANWVSSSRVNVSVNVTTGVVTISYNSGDDFLTWIGDLISVSGFLCRPLIISSTSATYHVEIITDPHTGAHFSTDLLANQCIQSGGTISGAYAAPIVDVGYFYVQVVPLWVGVSPAREAWNYAALYGGDTLQFAAVVGGGANDQDVTWSCLYGSIDSSGLYTAPGAIVGGLWTTSAPADALEVVSALAAADGTTVGIYAFALRSQRPGVTVDVTGTAKGRLLPSGRIRTVYWN